MTLTTRTTSSILFPLLALAGACEQGVAAGPGSRIDLGGGGDEDIYWCCDPDQIPCECPSLWHCTEGASGKRCTQEHPAGPDGGGSGPWTCAYGEATIVCRGDAQEHPDAASNEDWQCTADGAGQIVCERAAEGGDFPDQGNGGGWDCSYSGDGELRSCNEQGGGEGEGEGEGEWGGEGEGEGERGGEGEGEGEAGGEVCNGADDDHDGRIDEERACGDAEEGGRDCPTAGAIRICDAYCGVHQTCDANGTWGPCTVDEACDGVAECDQHSDCPRGFYCDYGFCSPGTFTWEPCDVDADCSDGFGMGGDWQCQADQGVCILDCYHHSDCGEGLVCDLGQCVPDPYVPGQC